MYVYVCMQVFIQDKRQTLRLRCPLPSRARVGPGTASSSSDTASLPPLDNKSSSSKSFSSSSSSSGANKGIGWRAPPMKVEKKEVSKIVTQSQLESAKRLSQGLSVSHVQAQSSRNKYLGSNIPSVLVMDDYGESNAGNAGNNNNGQQQAQLSSAGNIWLHSRLQRCLPVYLHTLSYIYTYIHLHLHTHSHALTHIHTHIYTHTYTVHCLLLLHLSFVLLYDSSMWFVLLFVVVCVC